MPKLVGPATEDDMVAIFICAELDSPRFGAELRSTAERMELSIDMLIDNVAPAGYVARRRLLEAYRGWGRYQSVFGGMPDDIGWIWAQMDENELQERVFTINWHFQEAFGTRRVEAISSENWESKDECRNRLQQARRESRKLEPPILLSKPDFARFVILEGHSRILSYVANPELMVYPIDVLIGTSERITEWSEW